MEFNATFFVTIISFIVFVFLMNKILYEPVLKIVNERTEFINGNYSSAEADNQKAVELNLKREEKLSGAKEEGREKYNELLSDYKERKSAIIQEAQETVRNNMNSFLEVLSQTSYDAKESLKAKMTDLANDIVEKVLGYRSDVQGFDDNTVNEILYRQKG